MPSASDNVTITNAVFFNGTPNSLFGVQNLKMGTGGSLIFNSGNLQMNGPSSLWTDGSVNYAGSSPSGPLLQAGTLTISSANDFQLNGLCCGGEDVILVNSGTIVHTNTGSLGVNGAHVQNLANPIYDLQSDVGISFNVGGGADFDNSGLFRKSGGTNVSLINIDFNNTNGTVSAQAGTLEFVRSFFFIDGTFNIGSGASMLVASYVGSVISNGTFNITSGGALNLTATDPSPALNGLFTGAGTGFFELSSGNLLAQTPCTFAFPSGFFHWTGGTLTAVGNTLTNTGEIDIDGTNLATLPDNSALVNQGRVVQSSLGALSMNFAAAFNNLSGGTYDLQSDSGIDSGNQQQNMNFNNAGLLSKSAGTG